MKFMSKKSDSVVPARRRDDAQRSAKPEQSSRQVFRRNRTITGSTSSKVRGVHESANQLKSPRVHAHELSLKRRKLGGMLLATLGVSGALLFVVLNFTATVHITVPNVATATSSSDYAATIESYFAYRPVERLRVFLRDDQLLAHVSHEHAEVASVTASGGAGLGGSVFAVEVRKPVASWTIDNTKYYVDSRGVSFTRNYHEEPTLRVQDKSGVPAEAGVSIASNRFLSYVGRTISVFNDQKYPVAEITIPFNTTRQIEVTLKGREYPLRLSIDRPLEGQVYDAVKAVQYIDSNNITPEYVDVRVSGKAYYL